MFVPMSNEKAADNCEAADRNERERSCKGDPRHEFESRNQQCEANDSATSREPFELPFLDTRPHPIESAPNSDDPEEPDKEFDHLNQVFKRLIQTDALSVKIILRDTRREKRDP